MNVSKDINIIQKKRGGVKRHNFLQFKKYLLNCFYSNANKSGSNEKHQKERRIELTLKA